MKTALIILTYNAEATIATQIQAILKQTKKPDNILIIDSSSTDKTIAIAKQYPIAYHIIASSTFNHGSTRHLATTLIDADIYIFMTQDAIPAENNAIKNLVAAFFDDKVGIAYGRQLPHQNATTLAKHARIFNYPKKSEIRSYEDRTRLSIRTCFNSDSFSAYRKIALDEIGGFPCNVDFGEDVLVAAKLLQKGWKIYYRSDAKVYHSHNLSIWEEFKRYLKIGLFHKKNQWILDTYKAPYKEGFKFLRSELFFCVKEKNYFVIINSLGHTIAKFIGYKLGKLSLKRISL